MTYSEKQDKHKITLGQSGNTLMMLIAVCLVMFVGLAFMKAVWHFKYPKETAPGYFNRDVLSLFILPAKTSEILNRPWTIITHMFVHDDVWKIFSNMLWLWCFGYIMQDMAGNKKIIPVFIYGALGGAIAFILAYNFLPSLQVQLPYANAIGASAGVMAVAIATTMLSPGYKIFPMIGGGLPLWILTVFYVVSDLATLSYSDPGDLLTHIAGAVTGFLFVFFLRLGFDGGKWMNNFFDWVTNLFTPVKKKKNSKENLFYKLSTTAVQDDITQQRVDNILDKISRQGYNSLAEEEKEFLEKASKEEL